MKPGLNASLNGWRPMPGSLFNKSVRCATVDPLSKSITDWWASTGMVGAQVDTVIPVTSVPNTQPFVKVTISGQDSVPSASNVPSAPIPANFLYQLDSDSHSVLLYLDGNGDPLTVYEFWYPSKNTDGSWNAKVAVQWNPLAGDLQRLSGVSANLYGGPILPYLINRDDALYGLRHVSAFTLPAVNLNKSCRPPAVFGGGPSGDFRAIGMGRQIRLRQDFDTSLLPLVARNIADGWKEYGAIMVDAGATLHFTATTDVAQYASQLSVLRKSVLVSDFEVLA